MAQEESYREIQVLKSANTIARIFIPDLTPEERNRRMNAIKRAAAALLEKTI